MTEQMYHIALASRPEGAPEPANFRHEPKALPTPGEGEVLVRVHYMSLDPYMRGRMDDAKSYAAPVPIGGTMEAGGVGEVIASNDPKFKPGDFAFGMFGWASHGCLPGKMLMLSQMWGVLLACTAALKVCPMPFFCAATAALPSFR